MGMEEEMEMDSNLVLESDDSDEEETHTPRSKHPQSLVVSR